MRHGKKFNHLSRSSSHRKALLCNLAKSIILNKRITTTLAKAKALRKFVERIMTKSKVDTTHSRRVVFSYFQDKEPVKEEPKKRNALDDDEDEINLDDIGRLING